MTQESSQLTTPTAWLGRRPSHAVGEPERWEHPDRSNELSDQIAWILSRTPEGEEIDWGLCLPVIERWEDLTRPAPPPMIDGVLSPLFVEWMLGLPEGYVTDVPGLNSTQMLRVLGNGVCPQQMTEAIRRLA